MYAARKLKLCILTMSESIFWLLGCWLQSVPCESCQTFYSCIRHKSIQGSLCTFIPVDPEPIDMKLLLTSTLFAGTGSFVVGLQQAMSTFLASRRRLQSGQHTILGMFKRSLSPVVSGNSQSLALIRHQCHHSIIAVYSTLHGPVDQDS